MTILERPIITEKYAKTHEHGVYAFAVSPKANKIQIKKAVEDFYSVTVEDVRTMNVMGKRKSRYTKAGVISGRKKNYKKAVVKLAEGEFIDIYENV